MTNQSNPNTNNVGQQHAADNIGSQTGNDQLDIILGKKETHLGSDPRGSGITGGELSRSRKTRKTRKVQLG